MPLLTVASRPRRSVQDLVTVGDSYRAFQNNEMFILIVMDMHWCAVARVRDKFEHRVCPAGVLGRGTNFESLTWRDLQPFAVTVIEESCSVVSHRASPLWWSARFGDRHTGTHEDFCCFVPLTLRMLDQHAGTRDDAGEVGEQAR